MLFMSVGSFLCKRMQHAKQYSEEAKCDLESLQQSSPGMYSHILSTNTVHSLFLSNMLAHLTLCNLIIITMDPLHFCKVALN